MVEHVAIERPACFEMVEQRQQVLRERGADPGEVGRLEVREIGRVRQHAFQADKRGPAGEVADVGRVLVEGGARDRGLLAQLGDGDAAGVLDLQQLKARGAREIASVADAATSLGLDAGTPLLGYVYSESWSAANGEPARALAAASADAKAMLASDDAEWDRLRPMMNAANDAEFEALKQGFRAGLPGKEPVNVEAAASLFALLASIGGQDLVGEKPELAPGTFANMKG